MGPNNNIDPGGPGSPQFRRVARNSQWGAVWGVWGRSAQPPEANGGWGRLGVWEFGGRRRLGVWGQIPQRSKILHFFCKNNFILGLF